MGHLNHKAFVNACRDERGVGHHTLRAYAQDPRAFAHHADLHQITEPFSRDDILGYPKSTCGASPTPPASSSCSRSGRSRRLSNPKATRNCSVVTNV